METSFKKYLLNSYVWLHYIAICTNSFIVFLAVLGLYAIYIIGYGLHNPIYALRTFYYYAYSAIYNPPYAVESFFFFYAYSVISLALINVLITIISTVAIRKIRRNESLNTFQKIIAVLFPLINIPLYALILFHTFILKDW